MAMLRQGDKIEQICICTNPTLPHPFYLTIDSMHGKNGTARSLEDLAEGFQFLMLPLESEDEAAGMGAPEITAHKQTVETNIVRREKPMHYSIRVIDRRGSQIRQNVRSATAPTLKIDVMEVGPITTVNVVGELVMTTSVRLGDTLKKLSKSKKHIIVDLGEVSSLASRGIAMLLDGFKGAQANGAALALLLDPQNPVVAVLGTTRLTEIVPTFTARDEAVAMLLTGG